MKTNKLVVSLVSTTMLAGVALGATACKKSWRNKYAYDIDFTADVNGAEVEFWTGFGSNINDVMEPLLDEFTKLTGVKV